MVENYSEVDVSPFPLLPAIYNMFIQDLGPPFIYISFHFPNITQTHILPPRTGTDEVLLESYVHTLSILLGQSRLFVIILCIIVSTLVTFVWFYFPDFHPPSL